MSAADARYVIGYVMVAALVLGVLARVPAPRWWDRWVLRRELRDLAGVRRRTRDQLHQVEQAMRARHPSAEQAGRELAYLTLLMVEVDAEIDRALDALDALK